MTVIGLGFRALGFLGFRLGLRIQNVEPHQHDPSTTRGNLRDYREVPFLGFFTGSGNQQGFFRAYPRPACYLIPQLWGACTGDYTRDSHKI